MWKIALSEIDLGPEEEEALLRVLRSEWFSLGPETRAFEAAFAEVHGVEHAVAVSSGSAALHLALLGAGVGPGDEVIVPSLTFVATAHAVLACGATPVFADVESAAQPTLDPRDVARRMTPRTRAILPVHYAGALCDLDGLAQVAGDAAIIEDAAHASGVPGVGTRSAAACFSFYANKNLVAGEGGMILTRDEAQADLFRRLRSHGMTSPSRERWEGTKQDYDVTAHGFNYRITELQSALGRVQLDRLLANDARRRAIARHYRARLAAEGIDHPFDAPPAHLMVVTLPADVDRAIVRDELAAAGIQTSVHYPPIHQLTAFAAHRDADLPVTNDLAGRLLTLPLHVRLTTSDVDLVVDTLARSLESARCRP